MTNDMKRKTIVAILCALLAALFYALNVPFSKRLLTDVPPTAMAGLLYMGAGLGVGALFLTRGRSEGERLGRGDLPYVLGMIALDIAAPVLLMLGLKTASAAGASLMSSFEIVATSLIALALFREPVSGRLWAAIGLITAACALLSLEDFTGLSLSPGALLVLAATFCWGLENNCTRRISDKNTYEIVTLKGLCCGAGSLLLGLVAGERLPELSAVLKALLLGFVAYGLSIFLYIRAQDTLGAAKTSAYYAVAPFAGVALSFALFREPVSAHYLLALAIMLVGSGLVVWDTLTLRHRHLHTHSITHTHDGSTHTHVYTHAHAHDHFLNGASHTHVHIAAEVHRLSSQG